MQLAAYAATKNPWLVARCAPDGPGCELNRLEFQAIHSQSLSPTRALEKTVDLLRDGKVVMTALRDGVRREMPAEDWRYWTFRTSPIDKKALAVCDVTTREPVAGWTNLLMPREQVELVRAVLLGRETPERPVGAAASGSAALSNANTEYAIDQNNACPEAEKHPTTPQDFRSGAPGRPSGMSLITDELRRRVDAGAALPIFAKEQSWLRQWLTDEHPNVPRPTVKTIKNNPENARIHRKYRETRKAQN